MADNANLPAFKQHFNVIDYIKDLHKIAQENPDVDMRKVLVAHYDETLKTLDKYVDSAPWAQDLKIEMMYARKHLSLNDGSSKVLKDSEVRKHISDMNSLIQGKQDSSNVRVSSGLSYPASYQINTSERDFNTIFNKTVDAMQGDEETKSKFFAFGDNAPARETAVRRVLTLSAAYESITATYDQEQRGLTGKSQAPNLSPEATAKVEEIRKQTQNPQPAVPAPAEQPAVKGAVRQ